MLTIVSCKKQSNITLIAKGQGGDRNGAILLQKYFNKKDIKSDVISSIDGLTFKSSPSYYIFVGQLAVDEFIKHKNCEVMDNVSFYSHIISPEIIDFAKSNQNITIITTESEKNLNKKTISSNVISIPLAIPTYLKSESVQAYEDNKKVIHELLSRATIHLGGLYKNAQNQDVIITDSQFQSIPKDLNLTSKNHVSVIAHPRTFKDVIDKPMQIKKRLLLLTKDGKLNKNMHFFVPKNLYDIVSAKENSGLFSGFNIQLSPPYNGVLYAINELQMCEQKQFVSVDQYNAFADIKCKVHGFLLNKSDVNQKKYLNKYNSINLNQDVLKGFLKIVK